jgi:hypothetical protein
MYRDGRSSAAWPQPAAGRLGGDQSGEAIEADDIDVVRALWPVLASSEAIMETGGDILL